MSSARTEAKKSNSPIRATFAFFVQSRYMRSPPIRVARSRYGNMPRS